jgi:poly(3-hydroxybutyrate) depolymerase
MPDCRTADASSALPAHGLCAGIAGVMCGHHVQPRVGHYGIFSSRGWRTEIYPKLRHFIRIAD